MEAIRYDKFYNYAEWTAFTTQLQREFPHRVKLHPLARTDEGRELLVLEITDFASGEAKMKPGYYVQAGLHAIEGAGVTAALYLAYALASESGHQSLLEQVAFHIVPCVDPDGMEIALTSHADIRSRFARTHRVNDLIPQDVDGDGLVLQMRWEDPLGPYKQHPEEPRLMIRRQEGDNQGVFYQVIQEGLVADYDPSLPIPPARAIDFNRSYPNGWQPAPNTTTYPLAAPELRAIADYMIKRPNIFAGVDFHCGTHAILGPDSYILDSARSEDIRLIDRIGHMAEELTGFPYMKGEKYGFNGGDSKSGTSNAWAYAQLGISHYIVEVGFGYTSLGLSPEQILSSDERQREEFVRQLLTLHDQVGSQIFTEWKSFNHPQIGEVEVGGLMVGNARFMHPPDMIEVVERTNAFVLRHAAMGPRLKISRAEALPVGGGIYRVRAAVGNIGGMSTSVMRSGGTMDVRRPVRMELQADELEILSYSPIVEKDELEPAGDFLAGEWFVRIIPGEGKRSVEIRASHPRAGSVSRVLSLTK